MSFINKKKENEEVNKLIEYLRGRNLMYSEKLHLVEAYKTYLTTSSVIKLINRLAVMKKGIKIVKGGKK